MKKSAFSLRKTADFFVCHFIVNALNKCFYNIYISGVWVSTGCYLRSIALRAIISEILTFPSLFTSAAVFETEDVFPLK